jgi:hypothetical protein
MALAGAVVFPRARVPQPGSWIIIVALLLTCMLTSSIALLLATVMSPLLAALATALVLGMMSAVVNLFPSAALAFPLFPLLKMIVDFSPATRLRWSVELPYLAVTLLEAILIWFLATRVFEARDVAIPVE